MDRAKPRISFITPLFYGNKYVPSIVRLLKRNIDYSSKYELLEYELILVNDSPDDHVDIPAHQDMDIRLINNPKTLGIHASRILGLKNSTGDYIFFLDQDDDAKESWLYSLWKAINKEGTCLAACNAWVNRLTLSMAREEFESRINDVDSYFEIGNSIVTPGQVVIKKKEIPEEWYEYSLNHNGSDDYYLWLLFLKKGKRFGVVKEPLFFHNPARTEHSILQNEMSESIKEVAKVLQNKGIINKGDFEHIYRIIQRFEDENQRRCHILKKWEKRENEGRGIVEGLQEKGIKKVAIYGTGIIGMKLFEELVESPIEVSYCIDKRGKDYKEEISCFSSAQRLPCTDLIIDTTRGLPSETLEQIRDQGLAIVSLVNLL